MLCHRPVCKEAEQTPKVPEIEQKIVMLMESRRRSISRSRVGSRERCRHVCVVVSAMLDVDQPDLSDERQVL